MADNTILLTSLISAVSMLAGATIPALLQLRSNKKIRDAKAIQRRFLLALDDIEYQYALLRAYEQELKTTFGASCRRELVQQVLDEQGLSWSGSFSPSKIAHYRKNAKLDE